MPDATSSSSPPSGAPPAGDAQQLIEANRRRARQHLQQLAGRRVHAAPPSSVRNAADRDAAGAAGAGASAGASPSKAAQDQAATLLRDKALGNYLEFDLTRLHNSKGGFLVEDRGEEEAVRSLEDLRKEREREKQRLRDQMEPGISLDPSTRPVCEQCGSPDILYDPFQRVFNVLVCRACERSNTDRYSLLTKTEVKEDYLLTDAELADQELLPHLLKKNPHKSTYSNMMLFMRGQVEDYAFSAAKWGSAENLDAEYHRRQQEKTRKRTQRFQQGLDRLRKRTIRDNVWQKRRDAEHVHEWVRVPDKPSMQTCTSCGQRIAVEEF